MKPRDHSNVQPWFELARADLAMADLVVASPDSTPEMFGLACFHAQQAAEKALKALVIAEGLPMPRSHDLVLLLDRVTRTGSHEQQLLEALLPVADDAVRADLAEQAVQASWTVDQLAAAVRAHLPPPEDPAPGERAVRPRTIQTLRVVREELVKRFDADRLKRDWQRLSAGDKRKAAAWLEELEAHVRALRASLPPDQ
jgi:HEPN domain-containing protein